MKTVRELVVRLLQGLGNVDETVFVRMVERNSDNVVIRAWIAPVTRVSDSFVVGQGMASAFINIEKTQWEEIPV